MSATVIRLDERRETPDVAKAWEEAIRLWQVAQLAPSIDNMAKAVDARRAFERHFLGRTMT